MWVLRPMSVVVALGLCPATAAAYASDLNRQGEPAEVETEEVPVYTNEDLPPLSPMDRRSASAAPRPVDAVETVPPLTYETYRDRDGHGKTYWLARVAGLEFRIGKARACRDWAYRKLVYSNKELVEDREGDRRSRWAYLDAEARLYRLESQRPVLRERARRAGALPGWLRELGADPKPRKRDARRNPVDLVAPKLARPEPGEVIDRLPRWTYFTWRFVPGAASYEVEIQCLGCSSRNEWGPVADSKDLTRTQYVFTFPGPHSGRWRVRASTAEGVTGPWAPWREFTWVR